MPEQAEETTTMGTVWQKMSTHERTAYLAPCFERQQLIRYAFAEDVEAGRALFGPMYPIPWHYGTIQRFVPLLDYDGARKPAMLVARPHATEQQTLQWDELYDVQPVEEYATRAAQTADQAGNGARCPVCGARLSIVLTERRSYGAAGP